MFHMDQLTRSHRVVRDVTYRWIPFLFVVLTVVVSTTLLSTSGHPPRGIVVTFGVLAGLLVVVFLACHLMMYCTRVKHEMDAERANGGKDDHDPDVNVPLGFLSSKRNVGAQAPHTRRERPEPLGPGRDEQRRQSQARPNHRISSYSPARYSAAQYNPSRLSQVTGHGSDRPQFQSTTGNRVSQDQPSTTSDQRPRDSGAMRHSSAVVAPLHVTRQRPLAPSAQPRHQRGLGPGESPLRRSLSRGSSSEDNPTIHTTRTSARTDAAQPPPPHETPRLHRSAAVHAAPQQRPRRDIPDYRPRDGGTEELSHIDSRESANGFSAFLNPPGPRAGQTRRHRADTADSVHARLALLGGPDVWGLVSRFLPDIKPGARLRRRMSADDCLRRPVWGGDEGAEVMVVRDVGCKVVRVVHPAALGVERVQSLRGSVRWLRVRDSHDSGYYSAGGSQQPQLPSLSQASDPATAFSATAFSATSVSAPGSSWPSTSSGSRISSPSSSVISEFLSLRPRSASGMVSEWMGRRDRVSREDAGAISVVTGIRVRREWQGPLGRSEGC